MNLEKEREEVFSYKTLLQVLTKKLKKQIVEATYKVDKLYGGTVGDVYLVTGVATSINHVNEEYKVVLKKQNKWER